MLLFCKWWNSNMQIVESLFIEVWNCRTSF